MYRTIARYIGLEYLNFRGMYGMSHVDGRRVNTGQDCLWVLISIN
ncbi:MAG: hypothetical protein ACO1NS_09740 [Daejeonella sp.]|nr:hypothetical protein [Daejeonella sp. JGW-45]